MSGSNSVDAAAVAERYARVRERIGAAARRSGRAADAVCLVVVTKAFGPPAVHAALAAGARDIGENYVHEAAAKMAAVAPQVETIGSPPPRWHMIGHLQSNKARRAAALFDVIHTVDGEPLARRLDRAAADLARIVPVLVGVNVAGELTKSGVAYGDALPLVETLARLEHLRVVGLMAVPPPSRNPEDARPHFRRLSALRLDIAARGFDLPHLSMGMTDDYEVAVEEGATIVRVGRGILGRRPTLR
jgi:hypothetical protein